MQLKINSFRPLFPQIFFRHFRDITPTFSEIPDISLTAVKFSDIIRFSRQVVTVTRTRAADLRALVDKTCKLTHVHCKVSTQIVHITPSAYLSCNPNHNLYVLGFLLNLKKYRNMPIFPTMLANIS